MSDMIRAIERTSPTRQALRCTLTNSVGIDGQNRKTIEECEFGRWVAQATLT